MLRGVTRRRIIAITGAVGVAASVALPVQANAARTKFGSELDPSVQPSNSSSPRDCQHQDPGLPCTLVQNEAYGRPDGGEKAPVRGKLRRIRIIAGTEGSFRLQLTKARQVNGTWESKLMRKGPVIHYQGQQQSNWDNDVYNVESFKVNLPIRKGWRLSMKAKSSSAYRCSSGGDNTLVFMPPLVKGNPFQQAKSTEGCWMLIEGVIKH